MPSPVVTRVLIGTITRMTSVQYVADRVPPFGTDSHIFGSYPEAKKWLQGCASVDPTEERNPNSLPPEIVYLYIPHFSKPPRMT